MTPPTDYSQYSEPVESDKLAQLAVLAQQQIDLEDAIAQDEKKLDAKREELRILAEKTLPELMDGLGMEEFSTRSGLRIKVAEAIRASIPKARQKEAVDWLDDHGYENLVKREFNILFGKEEEAWANRFAADLAKRKHQLNVKQDASVHNRTLVAFVKEQLEEGKELPLDLFGVFRQRYAKIEVRK
jgi:hypothetical protein